MGRVLIALLICCSAPALAEDKIDITQIYQNFLISAVAADRCGAKDPATDQKFFANLTAVTIRALRSVKEKTGWTDEAVAAKFEQNTALIKQKTGEFIDAKGCAADGVVRFLTLYKIHSTMSIP